MPNGATVPPRRLRAFIAMAVAVAVVVTGCGETSSPSAREFVRYHDPNGVFIADLPATHTLAATEPRPEGQTAPGILAGVIAEPPGVPSPSSGLGGGIALAADPDRTSFQVLVITSGGFESLEEMVLSYLTADPLIDVREERPTRVGGDPGLLLVADVLRDGAPTAGIAAVFSLGHAGTGVILASVFPPGTWDAERADFLRLLRSFRTDLAPGELALPF
jgi:hypothetical protein